MNRHIDDGSGRDGLAPSREKQLRPALQDDGVIAMQRQHDAFRTAAMELARMCQQEDGKTFTSESAEKWRQEKIELAREVLRLRGKP